MKTFEITDTAGMTRKAAEKAIRKHYHDNLTYRGIEFVDTVYLDEINEAARKHLRSQDKQESYLGYLPQEDVFVSGWDVFGGGRNIAFVKVAPDGTAKASPGYEGHGMVYMNVYNALHERYPSLVDIRLD